MDKSTLQEAAKQGIIRDEQVAPLLSFFNKEETATDDIIGGEQLKFIRSFGDVFITLGIVFVAISLNSFGLEGYENLIPIAVFGLTAEWLVRVRRLALPGIALLLVMLFFASGLGDFNGTEHSLFTVGIMTAVSAAFYMRHKMPFSLWPIAAGVVSMVTYISGVELSELSFTFAAYGLAIFAVAMWFDARDTERKTRLSDCAFWLHLLAAPLIVHGVMVSLLGTGGFDTPIREILIITFFVCFFLLALYVDRRALLVSSISYAIYAITKLTGDHLIQIENITMFVFMLFGIFIVFFGTYWYKTRSVIFSSLANKPISSYVPRI